jgi:hypothetical protein
VSPAACHLDAGFTLPKPVAAEQLLELVDAALDRARGTHSAKSSAEAGSPAKHAR